MDEIKTKKKLNKKPLIICLVLALVFGIVGFVDIKSNAAESYTVNVSYDRTTGNEILDKTVRTFRSSSPMQVYIYCSHYEPAILTEKIWGYAYVVSDSSIDSVAGQNCVQFEKNGRVFYVLTLNMSAGPYGESSGQKNQYYEVYSDSGNDIFVNTQYATSYDFAQAYINDSLDLVVDYNTFEIDNDMIIPANLKRNVILNDTNISTGLYLDTYDLVTWNNTSEQYRIELQRCPVVQIYKIPLFGSNKFIKEFIGEWKTEKVFEEVANEYLKRTDSMGLLEEGDSDTLLFESSLTYDLSGLEEDFTYFGYRIRYLDLENEIASPWLVLMPSHTKDSYENYIEYGDNSQSDKGNGDGIVNEYKDLEDLNGAIDDVKTENNFKDKYDVVDGSADTQEVMNWLNTVVSFIKGTPSIVTSVLSFLPQPILYGMYITIFLGCIASAIAIVKALI